MAKYPYIVKYNGEWYDAGEDVPDTEDAAVDESSLPFPDKDIEFESQEIKQYTKTDINNMSTEELQNLAALEGIENAFETSGNELKKVLKEHFGL